MIVWFAFTLLLVWNAVYCGLEVAADFQGPRPANGVWGLFALAGVVSVIAFTLVAVGVAHSGI